MVSHSGKQPKCAPTVNRKLIKHEIKVHDWGIEVNINVTTIKIASGAICMTLHVCLEWKRGKVGKEKRATVYPYNLLWLACGVKIVC